MGSVGPNSGGPKRHNAPPPPKKKMVLKRWLFFLEKIEASPSLKILYIFGSNTFFAILNRSNFLREKKVKNRGSGSKTTMLEPAQPLREYKKAKNEGVNIQ